MKFRVFAFLLLLCLLCAPALAEDFVITEEQASDTVDLSPTEPPAQATPVPQPAGFDTLRYGASNDDVRIAQQRLIDLGYYRGQANGYFDEITQAAVEAFQRAAGLAVTGKINATTWWAMMDVQTPVAQAAAITPIPLQGGEAAAAGETGESQSSLVLGEVPPLTSTLQYEDRGEMVSLLQLRLYNLGYLSIEPTGNFLGQTRSAVKAFQEKHRLSADGVVGETTWNELFSDQAIAADGKPKPLQYMLKVDVTNQITYAYELDDAGEYTRMARRMICSTGTTGWETPQKTTESAGARARWGYFPKWGSYAQYLTRIDSLNAFHSVLYSQTNIYTLNENSYKNLGKPASHGCVRLLVEDAKWIYDNCPNGTTITVYAGEADPELTEMLKPPPLDRSTMSPSAVEPRVFPEVWDPTDPPEVRQLKTGSEGNDVWWLQHLLNQLGYYKGTISGGYYGGTSAAVKAFQRDQGLSADGICGTNTWNRLLSEEIMAAFRLEGSPSGDLQSAPSQAGEEGGNLTPLRTAPPVSWTPGQNPISDLPDIGDTDLSPQPEETPLPQQEGPSQETPPRKPSNTYP